MGTFSASLKTLGDQRGLPATVNLEEDTLSITAGDQPIGSWSLDEIKLEPTANGYRMAAEGEQILIEIPEREAFAEELSQRIAKGRLRLRRKEKVKAPKAKAKVDTQVEPPRAPVTYNTPVMAAGSEAKAPGSGVKLQSKQPKQKKTGTMEKIDAAISAAQRRWGSLLPDWVFTRIMLGVVLGAFLLMLLFPGAVSAFLLAAAVLMVIFGAIVYTDSMLASKWLPGRMTPVHVLIFGVAILMFGVLLGVIAR
ncbi:MAG: hypothetical protein KY394_04495 [Actinobacteria bacterium]|nr:hypothetical protein [Actinomycetota bacterium]